MNENPLLQIRDFGQSVWMDFIRRGVLESGEFEKMVREDGIRGVTSNPTIFEKAIAGSHDYDDAIHDLALAGKEPAEIYDILTVEDVQRTADLLRAVYDKTRGGDGFVSLEVSPHLAYDTDGTVAEARRLWREVDRPNLLVKIPATREGLPAICRCIREGINVNVTLLFGLPRYREVAEAYIAGLEDRAARGEPLLRVASVASFFLSRIDVLADPMLERIAQAGGPMAGVAGALLGQAAVASAKVAYRIYKEIFSSRRFHELAKRGAHVQRLLWASTSTKNPAYADTKYVEPLIGPDTINTMPPETIEAVRDHGRAALTLEEGVEEAERTPAQLADVGIDLDAVTQQLEREGVEKFIKPFDSLMETLKRKCDAVRQEAAGARA